MKSAVLGKGTFGQGIQEFCFRGGKLEVPVDSYAKVLTISDIEREISVEGFLLGEFSKRISLRKVHQWC